MNESASERISISTEFDIVTARNLVRQVASTIGFGLTDVTRIVTAASELGRNAYRYAGGGTMLLRTVSTDGSSGLEMTFEDHGPGIPDLALALQQGYSTSGGLGLGLPGTKRLMDEFEIRSAVGQGTTVTVRKWRRR